jgi:hypothetical protein
MDTRTTGQDTRGSIELTNEGGAMDEGKARAARIDPAVRERIVRRSDALLDELDELSRNPSDRAVADARNAADALLRAVARVLIELADGDCDEL